MREIEQALPATGASAEQRPLIGPSCNGLGEYLVATKDLPDAEAFQRIRSETLRIVGQCRPFTGPDGQRTGLIVGYVQSGKTMSMTTVSAIARDNGCRIVVLLAGVTTNLLRQNATRFRKMLRGAAGGAVNWVIVNSEDGRKGDSEKARLREAVAEWRGTAIPEEAKQTLFFAILKNHAHLTWIRDVLASADLRGIPALILDDEADQAGLNVKPDGDPSTTYRRIAAVRSALPHHTYLQYTATPQAPLLISIDDLLSPEFADLVEPGSGYTGGTTFFQGDETRFVRIVPEADRFAAGEPPEEPPDSLVQALAVFVVGCGVARVRGKPRPRSMLVHPSPLKADHARFFDWIGSVLRRWAAALELNESDQDRADTLDELRPAYIDLAQSTNRIPPFEELIPQIALSLRRMQSKLVNSDDGSEVDWDNAEEHILVGGEKLNRGYTVEGLTVTYMPRDAGGWNADTLQQRARFFGYKQAYLDLCRIYLHPDVAAAFRNYVVHESDVRRQLSSHRGKPLRVWRRAFLLDRRMRPTRNNVLSDPLYRVKRDDEWFVQRYPHAEPGAARANTQLVETFLAKHTLHVADFAEHEVAEARLEDVLNEVLVDLRVTQESGEWYANLVLLSEHLDREKDATVLLMRMVRREPSKRSQDSDGAIQLHQGRSSKGAGGYPGDKEMKSPRMVTVQFHKVRVEPREPGGEALEVYGVALCFPGKAADAIGQTTKP